MPPSTEQPPKSQRRYQPQRWCGPWMPSPALLFRRWLLVDAGADGFIPASLRRITQPHGRSFFFPLPAQREILIVPGGSHTLARPQDLIRISNHFIPITTKRFAQLKIIMRESANDHTLSLSRF
ncbi:protein of unknown function [Azospirillum baldaniorum]|uniref:Uncharacterized protein n=1 Tax=Azospirillum baldaniorum TaxID=1064539 RepID=A0A9P1NM56_9PROT|nr:protein of unknown function [Azospirillum baldaniorum]